MEPFGAKLKRLIEARFGPQRQNEAARQLGKISRTKMSNWINGATRTGPSLAEGLRLARLLGVPVEYLADDDAPEPRPITPERVQIERWILRLGEQGALDRLGMMPAGPVADPAPEVAAPGRRERLNYPLRTGISAPADEASQSTPPPLPARAAGKPRR